MNNLSGDAYRERWLAPRLQAAIKGHPNASGGLIIYSGTRIKRLDEKIIAVPWSYNTGRPGSPSITILTHTH